MDHVAIMNPTIGSIAKILTGVKTIESRWSKYKIAPWDKIHSNDSVYFKYSGGPIIAKATVSKVQQFEKLDEQKFNFIVENFGESICLQNTEYDSWYQSKNYVTLIFLENPQKVEPFQIDKSGFGSGCAWITTSNVKLLLQL